jgi:hypothetical protein
MSEVRVRLEHIRAARFCGSGLRVWLKRHGFDQVSFLKDGIPAAELEATGDGFALHVAAIARARAADVAEAR